MTDPHHHASHTQTVHAAHTEPVTAAKKPKAGGRGTGFWLAVFCYMILYFFTATLLHTLFLWLLALGVIPALAGYVTGRGQRPNSGIRVFFAGMRAAGWPMLCFTAINLIAVHKRVGQSPSPGATFLVGLFVALMYGLLAGGVSGFVSVLMARQPSPQMGATA